MSVSFFQLPCLVVLMLGGRDPELCWGIQLTPPQCWRHGENSWVPSCVPSPLSCPGGCQPAAGLSRSCIALVQRLLAHGEQDPAVPSCPQPGAGVTTQEEACGCLSSCISGCGEILGILTGLEETSSVCGNRNCAPNQGGKQNPSPNRKAFPVSQPLPALPARAEQRDPSFPVWAETPGRGLLISASSIPARITLARSFRETAAHVWPPQSPGFARPITQAPGRCPLGTQLAAQAWLRRVGAQGRACCG